VKRERRKKKNKLMAKTSIGAKIGPRGSLRERVWSSDRERVREQKRKKKRESRGGDRGMLEASMLIAAHWFLFN